MSDREITFAFACACFGYAIVQDFRAYYWRRRYDELRNSPVIQEVARQLLTEQDIVDGTSRETRDRAEKK